jgi:hypothetical protein
MDIEQRVAKLERSARRLKVACGVLVMLVVGLGADATDSVISEVVRTKRLEIVGPDGKPCGLFIPDADTRSFLVAGKVATQEVVKINQVK